MIIPESWRPLFERVGFIEPHIIETQDEAQHAGVLDPGNAVHPDIIHQIEVLEQDLRDAQVRQAEFLRGLGHDLKSPLSSILRLSESLAAGDFGDLNDAQREGLELMIRAIQHLSAQAEALYAVGEVWSGSRTEAIAVDINQVIERIAAVAAPHVREKGVDFRVYFDSTRPMILAWPGVVERIVGNVIQNAIRYTDTGEISVSVASSPDCVSVRVVDTGIGIPEDEIALVGANRYRGSNASGIAGSGVGMAVVRHLLDGLGGALLISSEVGVGSTVTVELPRRPGSGITCSGEAG